MDSTTLADLIVVLHLAFVLFVILTELAILVGAWRDWGWIRHRGLRVVHLVCAWIPGVEILAGVECPLTEWEARLRERAGEERDELGFLARMVSELLFHEAPDWVFGASYVAFALLVSATFWLVRPGRAAKR
jgi:hypothetical protein